ncbi:hypothetical protein [Luteimicrobium subarcticum]|uniref:hypothetical protein n=1 Tax=Luteimicrobium subarcticum TaxID=620910 RepID=UPI001B80E267|nr:hypothetical protein [Luteimicrobium subarcticum]
MPLRVTVAGRSRSYRTPLQGWYVRNDRTMAVGTDGELYVLSGPRTWTGTLRGVTPRPVDEPPLVLGAGSRDGESIDLDAALRRTLGRDLPPEG